jgi:hypothetical protein
LKDFDATTYWRIDDPASPQQASPKKQSTAIKNRGEKKACKALHKALEKGIDVNFEELSYRYTKVD